MPLPTYDEAVLVVSSLSIPLGRNEEDLQSLLSAVLKIVAPRLDPISLARCARVCKDWSPLCKLLLWTNPVHIFLQKREPSG